MSWMKRRGPSTPSPAPAPAVPMYNPNQHSNVQENQWQNQPVQNSWYPTQQAPYQQAVPPPKPETPSQPQQNYWQQQQQQQQQQQYNPPAAYNQNNHQYGQPQQYPGYGQNNSGYGQQNYSNLQYSQLNNQNNVYGAATPTGQVQTDGDAWNWGWGDEDNSNVQLSTQNSTSSSANQVGQIEGAFANDASWNWGVEDAKNLPLQKEAPGDVQQDFPKVSSTSKAIMKSTPESEPPKLNPMPDHLTVSGKRGKLETPQWSTESQMSQESSDDVLHTSESDKSHMMSRSSTISHSPISGHDLVPPQNLEEVPFENKEIVSNVRVNPTPPPIRSVPPPMMPPPSLEDGKNPFKRTAGLSHTAANRFRASNITPPDTRQPVYQPSFHNQQVNLETPPDNAEQPDPVSTKSMLKMKTVGQRPDNNEAPINDRNQYLETGHLSEGNFNDIRGDADNPIQDIRSAYNLQDGGEGVPDTLPPPGLRRMVPGQLEQNESVGNSINFTDEPPPGLSRMVLGQTEASTSNQLGMVTQNEDIMSHYDVSGPPEGLRRMVPGESSSPESTLRHQQQTREENDSEPEFNQLSQHTSQPRSATIGADTPPAIANPTISQVSVSNIGYTRLENGSRSHSRGSSKEPETKRRDSIEGEPQETEISKITNSVRNLTVGENLTDGHTSNNSLPEQPPRRRSRQESSDSERESRKPPRGPPRDKRSSERTRRDRDKDRDKEKDKSRRERERYSPDSYRDKKYERRRYKDKKYEDDTDYYSDKERDRKTYEDRDRDYERKYSSLRKDKDKDRRKRDPRDYRREYYYGSRYDDFENEQRSRPSSRSDSMHDSYRGTRTLEKDDRDRRNRDRDREREKYRSRREPRESYNPYQGYSYDPYNPYYQQYQYYENLRRTNPQAYAEWYRKYYQQATGQAVSYGGDDRASVHSGRSSANDELAKDRYTRQSFYSQMSASHLGGYYRDTHSVTGAHYTLDASSYSRPFDQTDSSLNLEDTTLASHRLTPAKFATAHIKASISSGKLLRILPNYPMDGQPAIVEICNTHSLLPNDEEFKELNQFPGPLVKGVTHKKTIIEYCENKIKDAIAGHGIVDVDSYVLMWELLILLIRQNGMVVGADIAELLLKNRREVPPVRPSSVISSISSANGDVNPSSEASNHLVSENTGSLQSVLKEEEITNKFREFLLYGSGKEALEWAMKYSLWGHALFLASKLDKRTYANVMMRFANGLTMNDPLQTLYQLLSGKLPAAVTCVSDEKWGDWRPHLAMILSNSSQRPELNCKAITTLGDTLRNRGSLYAAQFCYLMAEVGFGKYDDPQTRLVLLGADHSKQYPAFATNEAIHMTEIYEYACGLNDSSFVIPHFQVYKYLLATRLVDRGLVEKSLGYLEKISNFIIVNPTLVQPSFVDNVYNLADRLKFYDLVGEVEDESEFGGILETSRPDNSWLKDLKVVQNDFHAGIISHQSIQNLQSYAAGSLDVDQLQPPYESGGQDVWQQQYDQQYQQNVQSQTWQPEQQQQPQQQPLQAEYQDNQHVQQQNEFPQNQYQDQQQNYWSNQQQWTDQASQYNQENIDRTNLYSSNAQFEPKEAEKDVPEDTPQPSISLPNQPNSYDDNEPEKTAQKPASPAKPKAPLEPEKTQSTGWFGGIFSKLALKPKNQMKLPDDKNPKIVWDEAKKRWVNLENDADDPAHEFKPPPKLSELMPKLAQPQPQAHSTPTQTHSVPNSSASLNNFDPNRTLSSTNGGVPSANPAPALDDTGNPSNPRPGPGNMFKLQKGRNLKNSYIDVFNPGGKQTNSGPSSLPAMSQIPSAAPQMNFFIPQQTADPNAPVDFLTPGGVPYMGEQQISRWSSSSSLSKEVQYYMQPSKSKPKVHPR